MMNDELIEKVAHILTGLVGSTCCHRTGGKLGVHTAVDCECRDTARAAIQAMKDAGWKSPDEVGKIETAARDEGYASGFPD